MQKLKRSECVVLHLVLKKKWYDLIESGEKKEEYRDETPYWKKRIDGWWQRSWPKYRVAPIPAVVVLHCGYRKDPQMAWLVRYLICDASGDNSRHREWGKPKTSHYIIPLGERVELED